MCNCGNYEKIKFSENFPELIAIKLLAVHCYLTVIIVILNECYFIW